VAGEVSAHPEILNDLALYQPEVVLWDLGRGSASVVEWLASLEETPYPVIALVTDGG